MQPRNNGRRHLGELNSSSTHMEYTGTRGPYTNPTALAGPSCSPPSRRGVSLPPPRPRAGRSSRSSPVFGLKRPRGRDRGSPCPIPSQGTGLEWPPHPPQRWDPGAESKPRCRRRGVLFHVVLVAGAPPKPGWKTVCWVWGAEVCSVGGGRAGTGGAEGAPRGAAPSPSLGRLRY